MKNPTAAISALRFIFWGGLLCLLDIHFTQTSSYNGVESGFRFDLLNDVFGMILIWLGVLGLSRFEVNASYAKEMSFIKMACLVGTIVAVDGHFLYEDPTLIALLRVAAGMVTLAATFLFCVSMKRFADTYGLPTSSRSWKTTRNLVLVLWVAPVGLSHTISILGLVTGSDTAFNLGLLALPILLMMLVPLVHIFISTSRMKNEIESGGHLMPLAAGKYPAKP
ncbi:MAG: hypothetical protein AAF456_22530 [Planctomycetota bacterium]